MELGSAADDAEARDLGWGRQAVPFRDLAVGGGTSRFVR